MANAIKIGNIIVPIIRHITLTGTPASSTSGPNLSNDIDPINDFNNCTFVGHGEAIYNPLSVLYETDFIRGMTDLTEEGHTVFIDADGPIDSFPTLLAQLRIYRDDVSLFTAANLECAHGWRTASSSYDIESFTRWGAFSYNYPDAAGGDNLKVNGYFVFAIEQLHQYSKTYDNWSYSVRNAVSIGIPNINRNLNANITYEEIPIPDPPSPDEPPFDPTEDPEPYNPTIDDTSDLVNIPGNPLIGVTSAGFINVYNPAIGALQGLGDILFPNVASATDIVDAVLKLCETLANSNLINYVIDCHVIPVQPQIGVNANIKVGFRDTGISVPRVTNDYIDATCGSLNIREYFGGFQDFLGTRSKLYLPFFGFVDVRPEFWQGGTLSVDYKFNVIDGSFMCYVRSVSSKSQLNGSVIAQYAGNACLHFPLTGVNYSQMVSGIVGAAVTMASGGGSTAVLGGALSAANTIAAGGNVQQSNGYSSTAALMGVRTPFLLIERAVPAYSAKYAHDKGFPTNIATLLSNVSGYTEISDIDLTGLPFTADELNELRQLLAEGVYF